MFICMSLDTKNQPTNIQVCSIGSLIVAIVHPREIYKKVLLSNFESIVVFHIHLSGLTNPSPEDLEVTQCLKEAGQILGIELLDHIFL